MTDIKTILVASDFSEHAERATVLAMDLARKTGASIVLLHVYEIPVYSVPDATLVAPAVYAAGIANAAQTCLDTVVLRHGKDDVPLRPMLREGSAARVVAEVADEVDASLIVVGTHGRTGVARAILGSVAERILRTAHRPVLAVPPPKKDLERRKEISRRTPGTPGIPGLSPGDPGALAAAPFLLSGATPGSAGLVDVTPSAS